MGQIATPRMESKRLKEDRAEQVHREEESKEPILGEKGDLQHLGEGILSQGIKSEAGSQHFYNEEHASAKIIEGHIIEKTAHIEENKPAVITDVDDPQKGVIDKANTALITALCVSNEMLRKSISENYSGI